jgi:hypothetical protein
VTTKLDFMADPASFQPGREGARGSGYHNPAPHAAG